MNRPERRLDQSVTFVFVVFLVLFAITRLRVFFDYNLQYIDTDQPYMWLGAVDFSKGLFFEPRYYGQSYNTFIEALFAVPLIWLNIPVYVAVPLATHFLSAFPFLFAAVYVFVNGRRLHACFIVGLLLTMPPHYDLLNSLPRGFVSGLFFCSFFVISFLHPRNLTWIVVNTFLGVTAYFVNPNSAVVFASFLVFVVLHNPERRRLILSGFTLLTSFVLMFVLFDLFYIIHPDYIQNPIELRFSTAHFFDNISNLDQRFAHISPFTENRCWALILLIGLVAVLLARYDQKAFLAYSAGLAVVIFSFCVGKTMEGTGWVFISFSRMYLGIPLLIVLMLPLLPFAKWMIYLVLVPFVAGIHKGVTARERLAWQLDARNFVGVRVYPLADMLRYVESFRQAAADLQVRTIVVSHDFWLGNVIVYGGPAVRDDFPNTLETRLDKRYRVRERMAERVLPRFLLISTSYELDEKIPKTGWFTMTDFGYGTMLIENNTLPMKRFCELVDAFERRR